MSGPPLLHSWLLGVTVLGDTRMVLLGRLSLPGVLELQRQLGSVVVDRFCDRGCFGPEGRELGFEFGDLLPDSGALRL